MTMTDSTTELTADERRVSDLVDELLAAKPIGLIAHLERSGHRPRRLAVGRAAMGIAEVVLQCRVAWLCFGGTIQVKDSICKIVLALQEHAQVGVRPWMCRFNCKCFSVTGYGSFYITL